MHLTFFNKIELTLFLSCVLLLILGSQISVANSQANAKCHFPRLTPRHGLTLSKLMGKWYLHEFAVSDRNFDNKDPEFSCNQLTYVPDGSEDVSSTGRFVSFESQQNTTSGETRHFTVPIRSFNVTSPTSAIWNAITLHGDTKMMLLNIDMDHSSWSLIYSCNISGDNNYRWETVGIWSRHQNLNPVVRDTLKALMVGLGFPIQTHKFHNQSRC